jgi:outer membrane protein OmpA-like peptidoglycan-associated protein
MGFLIAPSCLAQVRQGLPALGLLGLLIGWPLAPGHAQSSPYPPPEVTIDLNVLDDLPREPTDPGERIMLHRPRSAAARNYADTDDEEEAPPPRPRKKPRAMTSNAEAAASNPPRQEAPEADDSPAPRRLTPETAPARTATGPRVPSIMDNTDLGDTSMVTTTTTAEPSKASPPPGSETTTAQPPPPTPDSNAPAATPEPASTTATSATPTTAAANQVATTTPPVPAPAPAATAQPAKASAPPPAAAPGGLTKFKIEFPAGTADLSDAAKQALDGIAKSLGGDEQRRVQLVAYASGGPDEANQARRLSLSRALNVRAYLIDKGVRNTRMDVRALGNRQESGSPGDRVDVLFVEN